MLHIYVSESDTFDLAGQNTQTIATNISTAFADPFPLDDMIRITFVTGAGKLARQKYDEGAAKAVTSTLRDLGFEEDRGASCVRECAGSFKLQHDTGKNLKTVVVFPKIRDVIGETNGSGGDGTSNDNSSGETGGSSLLPKGSPEEMIALSSKSVFENMIKSKCASWSQKKGAISAIQSIQKIISDLEAQLLSGTPLSDAEQSIYDNVSSVAIEAKLQFVKDQMHKQVDDGNITKREKAQLLSQVSERIEIVEKELNEAKTENKPKKVEKLKGVHEKVLARKEKLSSISPSSAPKLKHEEDILRLLAEMQPLVDLEEGAKGRLLSVKETQSLARKDEILQEISELQEKSRGWFEDDESFEARVEACYEVWESRRKQKKKSVKKPASSGGGGGGSSWATIGRPKPKAPAKSFGGASKKPSAKGGGGGGVFAAMMMDSDSD